MNWIPAKRIKNAQRVVVTTRQKYALLIILIASTMELLKIHAILMRIVRSRENVVIKTLIYVGTITA